MLKRIFKWIGIGLLSLILLALIVYALLPKGVRDPMPYTFSTKTEKQLLTAHRFAVVAGTPWASQAGYDVLAKGGNACDAAVATLLTLNVTHGEASSFPGVAPTMYYNAQTGEVKSYIGAGKAPAAATIEKFKARGFKTVPELDIWSQLIPASPDVIVGLLTDCGTLSFGELVQPAIKIARQGFPAHPIMVRNLDFSLPERIGFAILMPENTRVWLRGEWWRPLHLNERMTFPDLANTLQDMANAEQEALNKGASRIDALQAVRDYFYKGPIAEKIAAFQRKKVVSLPTTISPPTRADGRNRLSVSMANTPSMPTAPGPRASWSRSSCKPSRASTSRAWDKIRHDTSTRSRRRSISPWRIAIPTLAIPPL